MLPHSSFLASTDGCTANDGVGLNGYSTHHAKDIQSMLPHPSLFASTDGCTLNDAVGLKG